MTAELVGLSIELGDPIDFEGWTVTGSFRWDVDEIEYPMLLCLEGWDRGALLVFPTLTEALTETAAAVTRGDER